MKASRPALVFETKSELNRQKQIYEGKIESLTITHKLEILDIQITHENEIRDKIKEISRRNEISRSEEMAASVHRHQEVMGELEAAREKEMREWEMAWTGWEMVFEPLRAQLVQEVESLAEAQREASGLMMVGG